MGEQVRDEDAVRRFVERFALDLVSAGMSRMPARVFAAILVTEEGRADAASLAEALQVSPAAISGAVRYLAQMSLIVREREPGARRDHFRVLDDFWYESVLNRDELLAVWQDSLREGVDSVGASTQAGARLEETRQFFEFVRKETPALMEKWRRERAKRAGG